MLAEPVRVPPHLEHDVAGDLFGALGRAHDAEHVAIQAVFVCSEEPLEGNAIALRRLTRINSPSPLNVADLDSDHIFDYPWIYAVDVNTWTFTDEEAKRLHDYLMKGGFLMVDDFHGTDDWQHFMAGMRMVLPDRPVEDLKDADEIYHVLYDINEKFQIPSEVYVNTGRTYEKDGYVPKWRAIRNDHGRIMVAICANMHLGDAWEWADDPAYPEKFSGLAFRIVLNYIMYAMTH